LVGVEAASQRYFGKAASQLDLAEAALLAGLPKAPSALDPRRHRAAARQRRRHVLERLQAMGWIDASAFARANSAKIALKRPRRLRHPTLHATDWALARLRRGGQRGGDHRLTLDLPLSRDIARIVRDHLDSIAGAGATQASVVVLDHTTCDVRTLVGSRGYFRGEHGAVNGALSPRQPGSALKPFTYALAFERGDSPASVVADIETRYGGPRGEFKPRNYTGDFSGPVLMADALGRSLNVPAVRVAQRMGARALLTRLRELGFASLRRSAAHYGLGLTLGNGEVTLVELAQAYATLARGGKACRARLLAKDPASPEHAVFSPGVAFVVAHALAEQHLRLEAFGPANALMFDYPVAVKTGTSTDFRDNWAAGFAGRYTVAVWIGDFEGRSLNHLSGARGAGPLFARVIQRVIGRQRPKRKAPPRDVLRTTVCALSGKLPGPHCPHRRSLFVQRAAAPRARCAWHRTIALDKRNGLRAGPGCEERHVQEEVYTVLPPLYAQWQSEQGQRQPPAAFSPRCPSSAPGLGQLAIVHPKAGDVYLLEPGYDRRTQSIELRARTDRPVPRVIWRIDGRKIAAASFPYRARWQLAAGRHVLTVEAPGQRGGRLEFQVR
jgi:penicillin-binding protein 1C